MTTTSQIRIAYEFSGFKAFNEKGLVAIAFRNGKGWTVYLQQGGQKIEVATRDEAIDLVKN